MARNQLPPSGLVSLDTRAVHKVAVHLEHIGPIAGANDYADLYEGGAGVNRWWNRLKEPDGGVHSCLACASGELLPSLTKGTIYLVWSVITEKIIEARAWSDSGWNGERLAIDVEMYSCRDHP